MKLEILILGLALTCVLGYHSGVVGRGGFGGGGPGGFGTVSKRDADDDDAAMAENGDVEESNDKPGSDDLFNLVDNLLASARAGIKAEDLGAEAESIQGAADSIVDDQGGEVDPDALREEMTKAASNFKDNRIVELLFDDPLDSEDIKMNSALNLLDQLVKSAREEEAAGGPVKATVAAISMTAEAIQQIVVETMEIIYFVDQLASEQTPQKVQKRWEFEGSYNHDPFRGRSWGAKISHSWRRRRRSVARAVSKRGWSGSAGLTYSRHGGVGAQVGVTYTFRK